MLWKYKDGRRLQAKLYILPLSSRPGSLQMRKRVIIVRGKDIGPRIVAPRPGADATVLKGAAKIRLGLDGGDQYGLEKGISVFNEYATGARVTNVPRIPTPPYDRSHADGSQQEKLSRPPTKRLRPDLDSFKYLSSAWPTQLKAAMAVPRKSSVMALLSLRPNLLHKLVCFFYASDQPAPRFRLFNACDTPQKLFAQATAGELFDPPRRPIQAPVFFASASASPHPPP